MCLSATFYVHHHFSTPLSFRSHCPTCLVTILLSFIIAYFISFSTMTLLFSCLVLHNSIFYLTHFVLSANSSLSFSSSTNQKSFHVDHWGPIINVDGWALRVNWLSYIKHQRSSLDLEAEVQFKVTVESPMACWMLMTNRQTPTSFVMERILVANQQMPPHFSMPSLDGDL